MHSMESFFPFLHRLADVAADAILPRFRAAIAVDNKLAAGFDPVTEADRGAERAMRDLIRKTYPEHGIIGEEYGAESEDRSHVWILDPVDGTRAFICGLPLWGCLTGLLIDGKPAAGMMSQPYIGERFFGSAETGSFLARGGQTRPITVRACAALDHAHISTTDPNLFSEAERPAFERLSARARLTRYGYDCYAYAMVAMGGVDCVVESGLKPYDIAPLIPIIEGAGGAVTSWTGEPAAGGGRILALGDRRLKPEVEALLAT
ncbi:histidinol-phosphatase [Afifella sp. H1R]|uniref:histidinol-phosphatase n=1 Tax=Afifella sp. H1R TaxID=2908841 RepID=UPI001F2A68F5|nr:histidinol-phosphatase [Afifella sp. H1R]